MAIVYGNRKPASPTPNAPDKPEIVANEVAQPLNPSLRSLVVTPGVFNEAYGGGGCSAGDGAAYEAARLGAGMVAEEHRLAKQEQEQQAEALTSAALGFGVVKAKDVMAVLVASKKELDALTWLPPEAIVTLKQRLEGLYFMAVDSANASADMKLVGYDIRLAFMHLKDAHLPKSGVDEALHGLPFQNKVDELAMAVQRYLRNE